MADSNAQCRQTVTHPGFVTNPDHDVANQHHDVWAGELASPVVCHSRAQQNTSGLPNVSTSMCGDPPFELN